MAKRYEYKDAKSHKFWEVSVSGKKVTIRYGKLGTDGQTSLKELGTPAEAKVSLLTPPPVSTKFSSVIYSG